MPVTTSPSVSSLEAYDSTITRSYDSDIVLPYTFDQVRTAPNEFLFAGHINHSIHRLSTIFDYLRSQTVMYNSVMPIYADFWNGDNLAAGGLQGLAANASQMWYIDGDTVVGANLSNLNVLVNLSSSDVGDFANPRSLALNSVDELYVLDSFLIHHYDISTPASPVYLAYYGGLGGAAIPTKFQSPREIHVDASDRIYVSDFGNGVVKIYNQNFGHIKTIPTKAYSITTDATLIYLMGLDGKVYKYNQSDFALVGEFNTGGGLVLEHDNTQPGYIYVQFADRVEKWTVDGFNVGVFSKPTDPEGALTDIVKPGNDNYVYVSDQANIYKYLDFQEKLSITDNSVSALHPLDSILVRDDEVAVPSIVYNDVLRKLEDNINTLSLSVTGAFVNTIDENDVLLSTSVVAATPSANWCSAPRIPTNYIPSVNTFNTGFEAIFDCSQAFIDIVLNGQFDRETNNIDSDAFCWSLAALRCQGPQNKNAVANPITFEELAYTPSLSCSPLTSTCCENNFPWFALSATQVSGLTFNFAMDRVSGSELFDDDELLYVIWSEDLCVYTNDPELDITFPEDGTYVIWHIAQDPGYLVHENSMTVSAANGSFAIL